MLEEDEVPGMVGVAFGTGTGFRSMLIFCFCISLRDIFSFFLGNWGLLVLPLSTDCKDFVSVFANHEFLIKIVPFPV